jgi:hypothetical protein
MFPWRWILGNQLGTEHVSWDAKRKDVSTEILGNQNVSVESIGVPLDISDKLRFPWIRIGCIRKEQNLVQINDRTVLSSERAPHINKPATPRQ